MAQEKIGVVGLGYVGIPLCALLADKGFEVVGIDVAKERADAVSAGKLPLRGEEPGLAELLAKAVRKERLRATTSFSACKDRTAVFVCVDTPIDADKRPDYSRLESAVKGIGRNLSKGAIVIVESTVSPGTMEGLVSRILEQESGLKLGKDFKLVHCPERVMSGRLLYNLKNYDRVIGGSDKQAVRRASAIYSKIMKGELHPTDLVTAEIVKTAENAYRDVQIAFANEVALISEKLGADAFEVKELVNTCPFRDMHTPGAGVGGHCLPKDPWLLVYGGREARPRLLPAAREINDSMPAHVVELAAEAMREAGLKKGKDVCIAIFGLAFLDNAGDTRNSPAVTVVKLLRGKYRLLGHDPYVQQFEEIEIERDLDKALRSADCAIFLTKHKEYTQLTLDRMAGLMRHKVVVDGRNLFEKRRAVELGIVFRGIGKG